MSVHLGRREFLLKTGAGILATVASGLDTQCAAARHPANVLLIVADDQGYGDLALHGNPHLDTPVLDSLAVAGAQFEHFYVSAVCAPTRASLLTGRYHMRMGVSGTSYGWERMRAHEKTLPELLKHQGYATGCFGKWHNGHYYPENPNGQGFDEFTGFAMGHWNDYFDAKLERNGEEIRSEGYISDALTNYAIDFMRSHREEPFFCYVPYNTPHSPFLVPDTYFDKYKARGLNDRMACVYGMVENIDDNVGRLLATLDELALANDTVVIYLSDNGPSIDGSAPRYNAGLYASKASVHEGGVRVPCFVRWPGHITPGTRIGYNAAHIDLLPTLTELLGLQSDETLPLDGISLAPLLLGTAESGPDRKLYSVQSNGPSQPMLGGAVRTEQWLAVREPGRSRADTPEGRQAWELYDIRNDPEENANVAAAHPEIVRGLEADFERWFAEVSRDGFDAEAIPVGYPEWPRVEIHAQDARITGNIRTPWANNGYIRDWTMLTDYPEWDLDVLSGGVFAVALRYTCPEADVGSRIAVRIGGEQIETLVSPAFDPPFSPSPQRVTHERYIEKDFALLDVGQLTLKRGPATLRVQALTKPGATVMELRSVILTRLS